MSYTENSALLDIGFVVGYVRHAISNKDIEHEPEQWLWYAVEQLEELSVNGFIRENQPAAEARRMLVETVGEIKGVLWHTPIAHAVSEALNRLCRYYGELKIDSEESITGMRAQAKAFEVLSDHQRSQLVADELIESNPNPVSKEVAKQVGASFEGVVSFYNSLGVLDDGEKEALLEPKQEECAVEERAPVVEKRKTKGRRSWTPEQRAEAAERARNRNNSKPPFVSDLDAVKADFEAGISFRKIGAKYNCSESHIRNFLKKHGVDARRSVQLSSVTEYTATPRDEYEWTDDAREKLFTLHEQGLKWPDIGKELGRTERACRSMYNLLLKKKQETEPTEAANAGQEDYESMAAQRREKIRELSGQGLTDKEIGAQLGYTTAYISQSRRSNNIPPGSEQKKIEEKGFAGKRDVGDTALWYPDDWGVIKQMLDNGISQEEIATDYGVTLPPLTEFISRNGDFLGEASAPVTAGAS